MPVSTYRDIALKMQTSLLKSWLWMVSFPDPFKQSFPHCSASILVPISWLGTTFLVAGDYFKEYFSTPAQRQNGQQSVTQISCSLSRFTGSWRLGWSSWQDAAPLMFLRLWDCRVISQKTKTKNNKNQSKNQPTRLLVHILDMAGHSDLGFSQINHSHLVHQSALRSVTRL